MSTLDRIVCWAAFIAGIGGAISEIGRGQSPSWPLLASIWPLIWMRDMEGKTKDTQ